MRLAHHNATTTRKFKKLIDYCRTNDRMGVKMNPDERRVLGNKKHTVAVLHPHEPSHTLTTLPDDLLHYSEPRILTVREYARLQSFPDWFEFRGKYTTGGKQRVQECPRYTQVGNAVAPFVAQVLGSALIGLLIELRDCVRHRAVPHQGRATVQA
jgi:DNA (cytosine-5)-methyltransferase 1